MSAHAPTASEWRRLVKLRKWIDELKARQAQTLALWTALADFLRDELAKRESEARS